MAERHFPQFFSSVLASFSKYDTKDLPVLFTADGKFEVKLKNNLVLLNHKVGSFKKIMD
jgi:hypothetical protein